MKNMEKEYCMEKEEYFFVDCETENVRIIHAISYYDHAVYEFVFPYELDNSTVHCSTDYKNFYDFLFEGFIEASNVLDTILKYKKYNQSSDTCEGNGNKNEYAGERTACYLNTEGKKARVKLIKMVYTNDGKIPNDENTFILGTEYGQPPKLSDKKYSEIKDIIFYDLPTVIRVCNKYNDSLKNMYKIKDLCSSSKTNDEILTILKKAIGL